MTPNRIHVGEDYAVFPPGSHLSPRRMHVVGIEGWKVSAVHVHLDEEDQLIEMIHARHCLWTWAEWAWMLRTQSWSIETVKIFAARRSLARWAAPRAAAVAAFLVALVTIWTVLT